MKNIINLFEIECQNIEKSIENDYRFAQLPYVTYTESGWDKVHRKYDELRWYQDQLSSFKMFDECKCSKFTRFITRLLKDHKVYKANNKFIKLYHCEKCNGYYSIK